MAKLRLCAILVLLALLAATAWASLHENLLFALPRLLKDPWAVAALAQAGAGGLWSWLWIAHRERCGRTRAVWLLGLLLLGNLAMAAYLLVQLAKLPPEARVEDLLLGPSACTLGR